MNIFYQMTVENDAACAESYHRQAPRSVFIISQLIVSDFPDSKFTIPASLSLLPPGPQQAGLIPSKQALMKPLRTTCAAPKQQTGPVKSRAGRTRQSI